MDYKMVKVGNIYKKEKKEYDAEIDYPYLPGPPNKYSENMDEIIGVRMTKKQKLYIHEKCKKLNMSPTDYIRFKVLDEDKYGKFDNRYR